MLKFLTDENAEYFEKLQQLVEETYEKNDKQRVILMLHSMGGPMITYFLTHQPQKWKDKYIEAVVSLAGAWGGSIKAIKVYAAGNIIKIVFNAR